MRTLREGWTIVEFGGRVGLVAAAGCENALLIQSLIIARLRAIGQGYCVAMGLTQPQLKTLNIPGCNPSNLC